jgi:hypothetical protein
VLDATAGICTDVAVTGTATGLATTGFRSSTGFSGAAGVSASATAASAGVIGPPGS